MAALGARAARRAAIPVPVPDGPVRYRLLGVPIDAVQLDGAVEIIRRWIEERGPVGATRDGGAAPRARACFVVCADMHVTMLGHDDPDFLRVLRAADLVVPDGMSVLLAGRWRGHPALRRRVYGPELMEAVCRAGVADGLRHFLYGGVPGVAEALKARLEERFPGVRVAGTLTPPFRPMTPAEDAAAVEAIERARPDIVWVGLSTPKQQRWMYEHRDRLDVPVMVGVGAAFDFLTDRVRQAPPRVRDSGFEWLWRLSREPRRLWRRILLLGPRYVLHAGAEMLRERSVPR